MKNEPNKKKLEEDRLGQVTGGTGSDMAAENTSEVAAETEEQPCARLGNFVPGK